MATGKNTSVHEYPEYLNPFDENYNGIASLEETKGKEKYNTWGANRGNKVVAERKEKHSLLERPWLALNISPRSKIVRKMSFLKTAVERLSPKKKNGLSTKNQAARSQSLHDDFSFKIVSPKQKEKLRQQAFPSLAKQEQTDSTDTSNPSEINGRLMPSEVADEELNQSAVQQEVTAPSISTPERESRVGTLGERNRSIRKSRKKRPPPPPPVESPKSASPLQVSCNGVARPEADDCLSVCSSITHHLEKGSSPAADDTNSLAEFEFDHRKLSEQDYAILHID